MKKKLLYFLLIYIFINLINIKVEAFTGTTTISEEISSTETGEYITLKHTINEPINKLFISYQYDTKYLQLVGFVPSPSVTCSYINNSITCMNENSNIENKSFYLFPIFKIKTNFDSDKEIKTIFSDTLTTQNETKTTINKKNKTIKVESIELIEDDIEMLTNETFQLKPTILPANATDKKVIYTSNDKDIVTVDENGLITAIKPGLTTITISSDNIKKFVLINVKDEFIELETIKLPETIELKAGEKKDLEIIFEPLNATVDKSKIAYASSDSKVAIIDSEGKVVGVSKGVAIITISYENITTSTNIKVDDLTKTKTKSNNNFTSCLITAIVTFILTIILTTIRGIIKHKKELKEEDNDDVQLNTYI